MTPETIQLGLMLGFALFLAFAGRSLISQRSMMAITGRDHVDASVWKSWAEASGFSYSGSDDRPQVSGDHNGVPFRLSAEITKMRGRVGRMGRWEQREYKVARTELRVAMRCTLPADLFAYPMPRTGRFVQMLLGGSGVAMFPALDETHVSETANPDGARAVLSHPDVMPALGRMLNVLPHAHIDARSVQVSMPGMPSEGPELDRLIEAITAFAAAVQAVAPKESLLPVADEQPPGSQDAASAFAAAAPVLSSAQLPQRRPTLAHTLTKVGRSPGDAALLTLHPMEYEVEFHLHKVGIDHRDRETGGKMVCGDVARSVWQIELLFDPEENEAIEALAFGTIIEGVLEVLDTDIRRKRVFAKSLTPPLVKG